MKKKYIWVFFLCTIVLLSYFFNMLFVHPIKLEKTEIKEINIGIEINTQMKSYSGNVLISKKDEVTQVVDVLNNIKAKKTNYSLYDIEGDSPTAWVQIYYCDGKIDIFNVYNNILVYKGKFYKMSLVEYNTLIKICERY